MAAPEQPNHDVWHEAQAALDLAAERLQLDQAMHQVLREPKRELIVHFPVRHDDGTVRAYTGYRVHHNLNRGPATGGVRFTADLSLGLVRALAMVNTWKAALVQIPYGGAMGGVVVDPKPLSDGEREGLTRRYATEIAVMLGPDRDIPMPDVNTGSQTMAWMMDTFSMQHGYTVAASVTGKPQAIGGSKGRREATSRGAFRCIVGAARHRGLALDGARVAIQGFGRVGSSLARMLADAGCRIVAVADDRHAVSNPGGIDIGRAVSLGRGPDGVRGIPDIEPMERQDIFGADCDILVSAGVQHQIGSSEAERVRAGILAEAASSPTHTEANAVLAERGVTVIPDILCTAGGFVVAYFEWVQDMQAFFWTENEVNAELDRHMDEAFAGVLAMSESHSVDLRGAAMMVAVDRVAEATTRRGLYP
jgi:glutamate dehydrogenase (NAD(P)+)